MEHQVKGVSHKGTLLITHLIFILIVSVGVLLGAPTLVNPTVPSRAQAQSVFTYTTYLPAVSRNSCPAPVPDSPFSLQIAALHQVNEAQLATLHRTPGGTPPIQPLTEAKWLETYEAAFPTLMEALKESGAGWARVRLSWTWMEPEAPQAGYPPDYIWGQYHDEKIRLVAETGVKLVATVADPPAWAAVSQCAPLYPDRRDEFARFLTDLVNHYKQPPYNIKHWELFNEPDGTWDHLWAGGLGCWGNDGDQYAQMLAVAYPAIKAADPEATVLMGGVAHDWFTEYGGPFYRYFPDEVMAAGGGNYLDGFSFHYFPDFRTEWDRWDPSSPDRVYGWLPQPTCGNLFDGQGTPYETEGIDLIAKANHIRTRLRTCFGVNKPIWVTELAEHGYAHDPASLAQQARYVIQGHTRGLAAGVKNITWYALTTPNDSYEQALLFDDWTPKPAFHAYKTLTTELTGYEYIRTVSAPNVEGYVFRDSCSLEKTVAWGSVTLAQPANRVRVVDRLGAVHFIIDGQSGDQDGIKNGIIQLQLSADPIFVSAE